MSSDKEKTQCENKNKGPISSKGDDEKRCNDDRDEEDNSRKHVQCEENVNIPKVLGNCSRKINKNLTPGRSKSYAQLQTQPPGFKISHSDGNLADKLQFKEPESFDPIRCAHPDFISPRMTLIPSKHDVKRQYIGTDNSPFFRSTQIKRDIAVITDASNCLQEISGKITERRPKSWELTHLDTSCSVTDAAKTDVSGSPSSSAVSFDGCPSMFNATDTSNSTSGYNSLSADGSESSSEVSCYTPSEPPSIDGLSSTATPGDGNLDLTPLSASGSSMFDSSLINSISGPLKGNSSNRGYLNGAVLAEKSDIVVMYAEESEEEAHAYIEDIMSLSRDSELSPPLTVDKFHNILAGSSHLSSLDLLHDQYRLIFVLVTELMLTDKYTKFLTEVVAIAGLTGPSDKADRVVPVWIVSRKDCTIAWLKTISGFEHCKYKSTNSRIRSTYVKCVKDTVSNARKTYP